MKLSVRDILRATQGRLMSGFPTDMCDRVSIDTRTLRPGDVFYALKGPHFDGNRFLGLAMERGARAVVLERIDPDMRWDASQGTDLVMVPDGLKALQDTARYARAQTTTVRVIGLTGSNGKTTTKEMLASILRRAGKTLSTRGNLNNHIGLPLMLCELEKDHQFAILEMGTSQPGDMDLLADLAKANVALITNVGKDHLEFFGTPEGVLQENRKLLDSLPKDGIAVINLDDPLLKPLHQKLVCKTLSYGRSEGADVTISEQTTTPDLIRITFQIGRHTFPVTLHATGDIQATNALAAAAVAHALGVGPREIADGLAMFKPSAMRLEAKSRPDGAVIVNDAYNANPSSMRASIESFCTSYGDRPRWLVLGDMRELGVIARQEHDELGRWLVTQPVERIFLYGRDARFILDGLTAAAFKGSVERYHKKRYLIDALNRSLAGALKPAILIKASRRLKLEEVSHALLSIPS